MTSLSGPFCLRRRGLDWLPGERLPGYPSKEGQVEGGPSSILVSFGALLPCGRHGTHSSKQAVDLW